MLSSEHFYQHFQLNHFDFKQKANRYLLQMDEPTFNKLFRTIINSNRKDFNRTIKMDVRFTFLLSIETLFEHIFALLPSKDGTLNDENIMRRLAEKRLHNEEIRKFSKNQKNILDTYFKENVFYSNGTSATLLQHLFYAGVVQEEIDFDIEKSLDTIYKSLKILSVESSNRTEINSYKHGFKGILFFQSFSFTYPEQQVKKFEVDIEDSITNYIWDAKSQTSHFETQTFDTERDIKLTHWCSNLMNNPIQCRKSLYYKGNGKAVSVLFFNEESLDNAQKVNVKAQRFTLSLEHER